MDRYIVYLKNDEGHKVEKVFFAADDNAAFSWARQYCRDYNDQYAFVDQPHSFTYENLDEAMALKKKESNKFSNWMKGV